MSEVDINYLAVLLATIVAMGIGAAWYSPMMFANRWMKLAKVHQNEAKNSLSKALGVAFVATLISAYVLAHLVVYADAQTILDGLITGLWVGIGISATTIVIHDVFEGRPQQLTLMNAAHHIVIFAVMGAILAAWP
jgi:hypothetical protein